MFWLCFFVLLILCKNQGLLDGNRGDKTLINPNVILAMNQIGMAPKQNAPQAYSTLSSLTSQINENSKKLSNLQQNQQQVAQTPNENINAEIINPVQNIRSDLMRNEKNIEKPESSILNRENEAPHYSESNEIQFRVKKFFMLENIDETVFVQFLKPEDKPVQTQLPIANTIDKQQNSLQSEPVKSQPAQQQTPDKQKKSIQNEVIRGSLTKNSEADIPTTIQWLKYVKYLVFSFILLILVFFGKKKQAKVQRRYEPLARSDMPHHFQGSEFLADEDN